MAEQRIAQSPTPRKPRQTQVQTLIFPQAMQAILDGKNIRKLEWEEDPGCFCTLRNEFLMIFVSGNWRIWKVSEGDMTGDDWVVV